MGITFIEGTVMGPAGKKASTRFLVDSGATYTLLPEKIWKKIGLKPRRSMVFTLADGSTVERKISDCRISFRGEEGPTPVILGETGDEALLGVVTLENLGLVLNPFSRTLHPMRMMLA